MLRKAVGAEETETPKYHAPVPKDLHHQALLIKEPGQMNAGPG